MPQAPSVSGARPRGRTRAAGPEHLAEKLIAGDRPALARAITLIESTRARDRAPAERLLDRLLPLSGGAMRLGVSGAPGSPPSSRPWACMRSGVATGWRCWPWWVYEAKLLHPPGNRRRSVGANRA